MNKAIIFDMDGVLVDSEGLWKIAEREVFSSLGVKMNDTLCEQTQTMTTTEVTKFWFSRNPWQGKTLEEVEQMVITRVIQFIESEDCEIPGIKDFIKKFKSEGFKVGLATNSPHQIIPKVLHKLKVAHMFDAVTSAEFEKQGKPEPDVYLTILDRLKANKKNCIVVEDSNPGIKAAKKAGMKVVAFTNKGKNKNLTGADYILHDYRQWDKHLFDNLN